MMSECSTDRLSAYLDDELSGAERAAVERHVQGCADCAQALADLRQVVARAAALTDRPPARDLWPEIAGRTQALRRPPRVSLSVPELAAAAVFLMALSGGTVWFLQTTGNPGRSPSGAARPGPSATPVRFANEHYDLAIADLERALEAGRSRLDPATVRILEENLAAIDRAIEQSRRALASDPEDTYLNRHLAEAQKRKLALLRRASALVPPEW
jgi:hypothetical protein